MRSALLIMALLAIGLTGCSKDPRKIVYQDSQSEQIMAEVGNSGDLSAKESKLLIAFMMRAKLGALFGGKGRDLNGMTIGQMIQEQENWLAEEKAKEDAGKAAEAKRKEEAKAYFSKISLSRIKMGKSVLGEDGVFGELKNLGNKTLKEVEITVYCLNKQGEPIFDKTFSPVFVSDFSFRNEGPLKPNYSRKFGYKLDDAPSEWAGKVRVEVSDVKFQ